MQNPTHLRLKTLKQYEGFRLNHAYAINEIYTNCGQTHYNITDEQGDTIWCNSMYCKVLDLKHIKLKA